MLASKQFHHPPKAIRSKLPLLQVLQCIMLVAVLLMTSGCRKDNDNPESRIELLSYQQTALTTFEIVLSSEIYSDVVSTELVFDDLTVLSRIDSVIRLDNMKKGPSSDTIRFISNRFDHDFAVTARLIFENDTITSDPLVISSSKNSIKAWFLPEYILADTTNNILQHLNRNGSFSLFLDYVNPIHANTVEVKLNNGVSLQHDFVFNSGYYSDGYYRSISMIRLNGMVEPGIYDVSVYIDGVEFKADGKIEILKGEWSLINDAFPVSGLYQYAAFANGDNLYITGGNSEIGTPLITRVWKYGFSTGAWTSLKDFPVTDDEILHSNLANNGTWYLAVENNQKNEAIELWKYNENIDEWSIVTTYPGKGKDIVCFMLKGKFFAGGGRRRINEDVISYEDFWSFDLASETWKACHDLPLKYAWPVSLSCTSDNEAYIFSFEGTFWTYQPATDQWTGKADFPGPYRDKSNITYLGGKVYLVGGFYDDFGTQGLKDCWEYDVNTNAWKLNSFTTSYDNSGFLLAFGESLYSGLGWSTYGVFNVIEPYLFKMTP
jgi:hypothetical protein